MSVNYWSRDEMILVLNLYLKMPFGKMHSRNPDVVRLAELIGRTPDAVALRLVNYAAQDPQLSQRGISGMSHGGKKCEEYWNEFIDDRERLLFESEKILAKLEGTTVERKYRADLLDVPQMQGEDKVRMVRTRVNQHVFRQIVLANYSGQCALTGIDISELLVASHILPWAENKEERLNPANGICLSSLYDKAFDAGLISFTNDKRVIFSSQLSQNVGKDYYNKYFIPIQDRMLIRPAKYEIDSTFLEYHREHIFRRG